MGGGTRSWYARLYGSEPGIDPYTRTVSDVHPDLFGEGSFVGKGIYQIAAFDQALDVRLTTTRFLRHHLPAVFPAPARSATSTQLSEHSTAASSTLAKQRHP